MNSFFSTKSLVEYNEGGRDRKSQHKYCYVNNEMGEWERVEIVYKAPPPPTTMTNVCVYNKNILSYAIDISI